MSYNIFMSYSRKDHLIAEKIIEALKSYDVETWVDVNDIPKGEIIESSLFLGIDKSTVFVFLISPNSVESDWCIKEIEHAELKRKKIIPVYIKETDNDHIPKTIRDRNYIALCDSQNDFNFAIDLLSKSIQEDYDWANFLTNLGNKATAWKKNNKNASWLIHGKELQETNEKILAGKREKKEPDLTTEQRDYLLESEKNEIKRKRFRIVSVLITSLVIISLIFISLDINKKEKKQKLISKSRELAAQSTEIKGEDLGLSLLLAYESYNRSSTIDAKQSIVNSLWNIDPHIRFILRQQGVTAVFSPNGKDIAVGGLDGKVRFYDINTMKAVEESIDTGQEKIIKIDYSDNGNIIASLDINGKIVFIDLEKNKKTSISMDSESKVLSFSFIPNTNWFIIGAVMENDNDMGKLKMYDYEEMKFISNSVYCECYTCNGLASTTKANGEIIIAFSGSVFKFDPNILEISIIIEGQKLSNSVELSEDGNYMFYSMNDETSGFRSGTYDLATAYITEINSGNTNKLYGTQSRKINSMDISKDGNILVAGGGGDDGYPFISVLKQIHGDYTEEGFRSIPSEIVMVSLNSENNLVLSADKMGNIVIWDLSNKVWNEWMETRFERESTEPEDFDTLAICDDSRYVVAEATLNRLYAWDLYDGSRVPITSNLENCLRGSVNEKEAINIDGTLKAIAGESTPVIDVDSGRELFNLWRSGYVKFSPDGKYIVLYGFPNHAYYPHPPSAWNVDINEWAEKICEIVKGDLSKDEWDHYFGDESYRSICSN